MPESSKPDLRWFPLRFDLIENPEFRSLTYSQVAVLIHLHSKLAEHLSLVAANYRNGPYVCSDEKLATALGMSVVGFRSARRHLQRLDWIQCKSGRLGVGGKRFACEYLNARYARVERGVRCAVVRRSVWHRLVGSLFSREVSAQDVAACIFLLYFWELMAGPRLDSIVLSRSAVKHQTGISPRAFLASLRRLQDSKLSGLCFGLKCKSEMIIIESLGISSDNASESPSVE